MSAAAMADLEQQKASEMKEAETNSLPEEGEEQVKLTAEETHQVKEMDIDLLERDPNQLNDHVKVRFADIFGEPDTEIYSFDKIWQLTFKVFSLTKSWCYKITTVVLAIPVALIWGVLFACLSFCNNWCYMPWVRCCQVQLVPFQKIWITCLGTFVTPCFQAFGYILSKININMNTNKMKTVV